MNNRTKGSARQPVPDSHATVPDSHARYQTEKVGTPLSVEFSCLRYEKMLSHPKVSGLRQHFCTVISPQVYYDVMTLARGWHYHREGCHGVVLCTTKSDVKIGLFIRNKRHGRKIILVVDCKSWTPGWDSLVPSAMYSSLSTVVWIFTRTSHHKV